MKLFWKLAIVTVVLLVSIWLVFSWFEADQEIRILCSMFHEGLELESVLQTLETGEYLRYRTDTDETSTTIAVDSLYNLKTSSCEIRLAGDAVISSAYSDL